MIDSTCEPASVSETVTFTVSRTHSHHGALSLSPLSLGDLERSE